MTRLTKVKVKVYIKSIPELLLATLNCFLVAWVTNKFIETFIFVCSFCLLRFKFDNIFHCKTTIHCILFTNIAIFIIVPLITTISVSLFGAILVAFVFNYFVNLLASDLKHREEQRQTDICKLNEDELRAYCKEQMLDEIDEEIIIQRLIYRLKGQALYDKIGYSKPQMIRGEHKIEEKLNIKLKDR